MFVCFFFFKQKTAYEMRISDWSSDVCSSDLIALRPDPVGQPHYDLVGARLAVARQVADGGDQLVLRLLHRRDLADGGPERAAGAEGQHHRRLLGQVPFDEDRKSVV